MKEMAPFGAISFGVSACRNDDLSCTNRDEGRDCGAFLQRPLSYGPDSASRQPTCWSQSARQDQEQLK